MTSPPAIIRSPALKFCTVHSSDDLFDQFRRHVVQQFLLGERDRIHQMGEAAEAVNNLVFGPFNRLVEPDEMAQLAAFSKMRGQRCPIARASAPDPTEPA